VAKKIYIRDGTKEANRWMATQLLNMCRDLLNDGDKNNARWGEEILVIMNKYGIVNDGTAQPFKSTKKMLEAVKDS